MCGAPVVSNLSIPSINVSFDVGQTPVSIGGTVQLTDASTTDGSPIKAWSWDFGDGQIGIGRQVAHAYAAGGSFTVTLIITDTCNFTASVVVPDAVLVLPVRTYLPLITRPAVIYLPVVSAKP